jgi:hypothetical protein
MKDNEYIRCNIRYDIKWQNIRNHFCIASSVFPQKYIQYIFSIFVKYLFMFSRMSTSFRRHTSRYGMSNACLSGKYWLYLWFYLFNKR